MTRFADKSFSSRPSTDAYRDGWDATFPSRSEQRRRAAVKGEPMPRFAPGDSNRPYEPTWSERWDESQRLQREMRMAFGPKPKKAKRGKR